MKAAIVYYSRTGNTKKPDATVNGDVKLIDVTECRRRTCLPTMQ